MSGNLSGQFILLKAATIQPVYPAYIKRFFIVCKYQWTYSQIWFHLVFLVFLLPVHFWIRTSFLDYCGFFFMTVPYIGFCQGIFSFSFLCYLWPQWLGRLLHFSKVPQYRRGSAKNRNLWKWEQKKIFHFRSGDKDLFIYILVKYYRFCSGRYTGVLSYTTFGSGNKVALVKVCIGCLGYILRLDLITCAIVF